MFADELPAWRARKLASVAISSLDRKSAKAGMTMLVGPSPTPLKMVRALSLGSSSPGLWLSWQVAQLPRNSAGPSGGDGGSVPRRSRIWSGGINPPLWLSTEVVTTRLTPSSTVRLTAPAMSRDRG